MRKTIQTTIDSAGRIVLPKVVREEVGILPGMSLQITTREGRIEIEPMLRRVRIVQKEPIRIAVPDEPGPPLTEAIIEQVRREMRERNE